MKIRFALVAISGLLALSALQAAAAPPPPATMPPPPIPGPPRPMPPPGHPPKGPPKPAEHPYVPKPTDVVILYEHADFQGRAVGLAGENLDLQSVGFNDMASSIKVRNGHQATFFEDVGGHGEWFTFNCPDQPIGIKQSDFCELKNVGTDIATGALCQFRPTGATGCVPWWNDRISGVGRIGPADPAQPQARIDNGHS